MVQRKTKVPFALALVALVWVFLGGVAYSADAKGGYGLPVGAKAPAIALPNQEGEVVSLADRLKAGPVVLVFYRGDWCPFCNKHLKELQGALKQIEAHGASLLAVSVDKPPRGKTTWNKNKLAFDVLSDSSAKALGAYRVRYQVDAETQKLYKRYGVRLDAYSGRKDGVIAVPAVFVIDRGGVIRFAFANEDYKVRAQPKNFLPVLAGLSHP